MPQSLKPLIQTVVDLPLELRLLIVRLMILNYLDLKDHAFTQPLALLTALIGFHSMGLRHATSLTTSIDAIIAQFLEREDIIKCDRLNSITVTTRSEDFDSLEDEEIETWIDMCRSKQIQLVFSFSLTFNGVNEFQSISEYFFKLR
ncbi:unnamed protein product [Ambrosiozyma monospora]|uniref:Unnamed protein product n=1 Tax=Ambrosiozyma monospora TaxID=43982 RepID=A0ACB5TAA0_AMBMO|nr:unnamed protein product [Ambrosiozyma monospora]